MFLLYVFVIFYYRIAALKLWKQRTAFGTYHDLLKVCCAGGDSRTATIIQKNLLEQLHLGFLVLLPSLLEGDLASNMFSLKLSYGRNCSSKNALAIT